MLEEAYRDPDNPVVFRIHAGLLSKLLRRDDILLFTWQDQLRAFCSALPENPLPDPFDFYKVRCISLVLPFSITNLL